MKRLFRKLGFGVAVIVFSYLSGYAERGYFAHGAEILISLAIVGWMLYEVYLFGMAYERLRAKNKSQQAFVRNLQRALIQSNSEQLRLEKENKALVNGMNELSAWAESVKAL